MKNRKLTMVASIILVISMLFGTMTVAATDAEITATTTEVTTTAPADETTTEPTTQAPTEETTEPTTEAPTDETTTTADSYYDDSEYESEEEKEAYDEGYWDGYSDGWDDAKEEYEGEDYDSGYDDGWDNGYDSGEWDGYYDGYDDGYYEGYYDAIQDMENKDVITIFDRWDAFIEDLRERIEDFVYNVRAFFERIFNFDSDNDDDYYEPEENYPSFPSDESFFPDGSQPNLENDANAQAICDEVNSIYNNFCYAVPEDVRVSKLSEIITIGKDVTSAFETIINPVLEKFTGATSRVEDFEKGDCVYFMGSVDFSPAGLTEATKTVNEDGTTDYKLVLIEEATYYNGNETKGFKRVDGEIVEYQTHHEVNAGLVYFEAIDIEPLTVKEANIFYPGATFTLKTDAQGRLIKCDMNMPVEGYATGMVGRYPCNVSAEGSSYVCITMDYDA